eukprot:TRINITY_DN503_c0_g1_i1.p1 TRINITY_DN503_c0_g1~~TRINITY_DN503_c0_g1_i1.p1  ORF type:complete len:487 (-),score=87.14 TRINITY_DN503_c0_g1_i1:130-1590(-)
MWQLPSGNRCACLGGLLSLAVVALILPFVLTILGTNYDYGVVIDAGSSGSRVHIYQWHHRRNASTSPDVIEAPIFSEQKWSFSVRPGLSSYGTNPAGASASVQQLLDYAITLIPASKLQNVPVYVFATAGMRVLEEQHPIQCAAVLDAVRQTVAASGFSYTNATQVRIITGQEEAVFGWVTINYALGLLGAGQPPSSTVGTLDLGGASTQIAFIPQTAPPLSASLVTLTLLNAQYVIYAESFLGFGADEARFRVNASLPTTAGGMITDPCVNTGYQQQVQAGRTLVGSGDYVGCDAMMDSVALNITNGATRINGALIPALSGSFYAFSSYYYVASFLGLGSSVNSASYSQSTSQFCNMSWSDVLATYTQPSDEAFLDTYCFVGTYVAALITRGLGFAVDTNLTVASSVADVETGWTLGAMTYQAGLLPWVSEQHDPPAGVKLVTLPGGIVLTVFGVVGLLVVVGLFFWYARTGRADPERKKIVEDP